MKKTIFAAAMLAASFGAAQAADLPARMITKAPPLAVVYDWTGFYIGGNAGSASLHKCFQTERVGAIAVVGVRDDGCHNGWGPTAGGQIGYRWQTGTWVWGLEAQGNWANIRGESRSVFFGPPFSNRSHVDALGLFTGQVGYAINNALLYVKGGAAVTRDTYEGFATAPGFGSVPFTAIDRASETRWGGTVGVGLEFGWAPNWTAGIEYNHLFLGSRGNSFNATAAPAGISRVTRIDQDVDLFLLRLNYRFGWSAAGVARF